MTPRFVRWAAAPLMLLALTGCTQLTNADGFATTPVAAPSPSEMTWWEKEQMSSMNVFGIPEETPEALTKDSLPIPADLVPEGASNAVSVGDLEATTTQRTLHLPKPLGGGDLWVDFVCVDGEINIESDSIERMGILCDGTLQGYTLEPEQKSKRFHLKLKVAPGTSYSVAVYEDPIQETSSD